MPTLTRPAFADIEAPYKRVGDLAVYLGVIPAAMLRGHDTQHPESQMHGTPPRGVHAYHIVVAVFDAESGRRIEDAQVAAIVSGLGHVGRISIRLEPMVIAGTVTYGNFVALSGIDRYTIAVEIRRTGHPTPQHVDFTYEHRFQ
ncbi:hypothetical protein ABY43_21335 [Rhizobium giardinii]